MFEVFLGADKCSVQVTFHKTRYYVKNGRRQGIIPFGVKLDPGSKEDPGGEPFVCDTLCQLRIYCGGEWINVQGIAKMSPNDIGKYNKATGRKLALKRALADKQIHGPTKEELADDNYIIPVMYDLNFAEAGLPQAARQQIWDAYFAEYHRR